MDLLQGRKVMIWSFMGNARMYEALNKYGDRLDIVGIFTFEVDGTGKITETGTSISNMLPYIGKWKHIKWLLTIMNHGTASIFTALRNNSNGAQDMFISEIIRIINKYPWCAGVDIDLERGGGYENKDAANALFSRIYSAVKAKQSSLLVNICLPGMTSVNGSVGGENWCVYADLNNYCDTAAIMSYGMAWAGSAPGPISPRDWLEGTYDYAITAMNPDKIFFGLPAYGWNWQIYDTPQNLGKTYRGTSNTYYAAKYWMTGVYNFTGDAPPQPFIPFVAYWDDVNKVPWALPHVYDYMEGWDVSQPQLYPLVRETYKGKRYLTSYSKDQKVEFGSIYIDRNGIPDNFEGDVIVTTNMAYLAEETATASYELEVSQAGYYDVAVRLSFPFWDKNSIDISLDDQALNINENRLWWPYWRKIYWRVLSKNVFLSEGQHTISISGGVPGVQFYGFRVCSSFSERPFTGEAVYSLSPRKFKDVNGIMTEPASGFKLTLEMLRRKADSALVLYEDFRDYTQLPSSYYETLEGSWAVWRDADSGSSRPYSQLEGQGRLSVKYDGFTDIHLRAKIAFPEDGGGRAGLFFGDIFCCLNFSTQRVELYQGIDLMGSYSTSFSKTPNSDIRKNPNMYTVEMRKRGNKIRVYSGASNLLRFTATVSAGAGRVGVRSDNPIKCELLRLGDAWVYEPYECFDVELPSGQIVNFGRLPRSNVTWDSEFNVLTVTSDIEESETRADAISLDYDFYHTVTLPLVCGNDYPLKIVPRDINVWLSRLFLGDAQGFSILYYQDVDSLVYWANEAAYRWKLRGIAIWSLGQEDLRLWEAMPKQI